MRLYDHGSIPETQGKKATRRVSFFHCPLSARWSYRSRLSSFEISASGLPPRNGCQTLPVASDQVPAYTPKNFMGRWWVGEHLRASLRRLEAMGFTWSSTVICCHWHTSRRPTLASTPCRGRAQPYPPCACAPPSRAPHCRWLSRPSRDSAHDPLPLLPGAPLPQRRWCSLDCRPALTCAISGRPQTPVTIGWLRCSTPQPQSLGDHALICLLRRAARRSPG